MLSLEVNFSEGFTFPHEFLVRQRRTWERGWRWKNGKKKELIIIEMERENKKKCAREAEREEREHMPLRCAKPGSRSNGGIGFIETICREKRKA